jgi:hypothetical protein
MKFTSLAKKKLCEARFKVVMIVTMALAVKHQPLTAQHPIHMECEVEKVSLGQDFLSHYHSAYATY